MKMPFLRKDRLEYDMFCRFWLLSAPVSVKTAKTASDKAEVLTEIIIPVEGLYLHS